MLRDIRLPTAIILQNRQDLPLRPVSDAVMAALYNGDGEHFMVEAVDMLDIESTYFYDTPTMPEVSAMFEAVTSTRGRLAGTMRAFIRALNQSLNGSGITAGNDTTGATDDGSQSIGGANIGRVRKVQGLAVMPAIIPMSDGQTVTLVFHSPTGNAATIVASDTLVAFQFLLNKKDVTHVVSPSNGRDISLKVVTTALSNLIERNTAKFQHAQAKQKAVKAEIATMQEEGDKLEVKQAALVEQGDTLKAAVKSDAAMLSELSHKADQQEELNEELQAQVAAAQKKKDDAAAEKVADRSARAGALEAIQAKSGYKDTYVANWAYNANIPTADLVDLAGRLDAVDTADLKDLIMYKGRVSDLSDIPALKARNAAPLPADDPGPRTLYWYGLRARPAGVGALPQDPQPVVTATPEEAADIPIVKAKNFDPSNYRYGAVAYAAPLDVGDVAQYELVDFQNAQTPSSISTLLNDLVPLMKAYPGNENEFYLDYLTDDAPKAADLPQSMKDAGGFRAVRTSYGSKITLQLIEMFKQVKKDSPPPPPVEPEPTVEPEAAAGPVTGADKLGALIDMSGDLVSAWAQQRSYSDDDLRAAALALSLNHTAENIKLVLDAVMGGKGFPNLNGSGGDTTLPPDSDTPIDTAPPAAKTKRKLVARATEETKGEGEERDGRIMMSIEGPRDFIEWAEKDLAQDFNSLQSEGEGKNEGEIGLYFSLDRADKPQFMERWKQLKAAWINGDDYPPLASGATPPPAPDAAAVPDAEPAAVTPDPDDAFAAYQKAAQSISDLTGHGKDAVDRWADARNLDLDDLQTLAAQLAANPTPDNVNAMKNAIDFGSPVPTLKEAAPVDVQPEPEPEKPEADTAAQQAIDYLKQVAEMQTSDLVEIRTARGNVRQAIAALTAAGIYDENEALVNAAAQHLADLLAAVAQKGAA